MSNGAPVAVVTGGGRGIGRAIVVALAEHGFDVGINFSSSEAAARETAEQVVQYGRRAVLLPGDVGRSEQVESFIDRACEELGRLDVLVNNAGVVADGLLASMSDDHIDGVIRTNLLGAMYCTRAAARHMVRQRQGRIVNISSVSASRPGRGQANYAAAKGGLEAFTRAMAVELAPKNILVNAVAPGVIETDMTAFIRERGETEIMGRLLIKRYGQPSDVAQAVLFLADAKNTYMTGEVLQVTGGLKMA